MAELYAIFKSLCFAYHNCHCSVLICTDSTHALLALSTLLTCWILGRAGPSGNELVDQAAKEAVSIKNEKDAKENNRKNYESFLHRLNTWNAAVNFCEPPPAHLKYQYHPPTQAILVNISRTLAAVPKFYTQVLHLMNKMNLPSPFEPCFFPETSLPGGSKQQSEIVDVGETNQQNESSEEESEIESDEEGQRGPKDIIPEKRSLPQKKKRVKRPKLIQLTQILPTATSKSVMKPEEVFEKPQVEPVQRKIELKLPPEAISAEIVTEDMSDSHGGFGLMFPTHQGATEDQPVCLEEDRDIASDSSSVITLDQLAANRISTRDQRHLPVFKNYQPGVPSCRLYIKNLSKQVVERDLHFIYRRYLIPDFEEQGTMFDIRLMKEGRMKGQAFITLQTVKQAEQALEETNGFILKDKPMVVQFARSAKVK
uniref:RNA-binding region-containing protein 3 n=1 Tax=Timema shepardi TaxID=629360 RepID=A0A7R9G621_TIMSH|nr:unnamed protein product [Timema shepardi]